MLKQLYRHYSKQYNLATEMHAYLSAFFAILPDNDVGLHVLGCRFDILGTNCRTILPSFFKK